MQTKVVCGREGSVRQYILGGTQCGTEWYKFYWLKTHTGPSVSINFAHAYYHETSSQIVVAFTAKKHVSKPRKLASGGFYGF